MSERWSTLSAALLVSFSLGACGGEQKQPEAAPAAASPVAESAPVAAASTNLDSLGKVVYGTCTTCHQLNGEGMPGAFPPLAGSSIVTGPPEIPIAIILHGLQGPLTVNGKEYNGVMTPWGAMFDDLQIAGVVTYIRSNFGNDAPAVTPEQVAKVRAATAARNTAWTWAELQAAKF